MFLRLVLWVFFFFFLLILAKWNTSHDNSYPDMFVKCFSLCLYYFLSFFFIYFNCRLLIFWGGSVSLCDEYWLVVSGLFGSQKLSCCCHLFYYAAAKSLQSCPTLCDPMDCSLPGFSAHGILQARTLEWVAISFSICMLDKGIKLNAES